MASHGAAIGIIFAIFLYVKRLTVSLFPLRIHLTNRRPTVTFLWLADHLVILGALGCAIIRIGNFMNSEIIGQPTGSNYGVIFVRDLHDHLCKKYDSTIQNLVIRKATTANRPPIKGNYPPIELAITFKRPLQMKCALKIFFKRT